MSVSHKGWDWTAVPSDTWNTISEEFLPIALEWRDRFKSILDVGAGKGRHALYFAKYGLDVSAVDLSESSIEYIKNASREQHLDVNAIVSDMTSLPFEDGSFDGIICFHSIYHTNYAGLQKAIKEIKRVLRVGGEVYITFNTKENPNYIEKESEDGYTIVKKEGLEAGIPHCYVNETDINHLLEDFTIISFSKITNYIRKEKSVRGTHYFVHIRYDQKE